MNRQMLELARQLADAGEPFAFATVVWRRAPSSGKEGSTAVIRTDGTVRGWLGGACAEPAVVREARTAISEGTPRLLFLGTPEELAEYRRQGVVRVPIACQSEGALEVYVEPVLPKPHLVVIGRSPAVDTLAGLAKALGWEAVVVDDGGSERAHPSADRVVTSLDLPAAGAGPRSFVVVATQGHYDEDALQRALEQQHAYVALVASRKRAESVIGYLRDRGVPEEALARVHAPAGLDLGAVSHEEIAVAILAEIVKERAAGEIEQGIRSGHREDHEGHVLGDPAAEARHEKIDPVCGMTVDVATARNLATHEGRTYYFCSVGCRATFEADPAPYAVAASNG
ncbi:MAG: XdhC family protein [Actinomycetota bacterium]